MTLKQLNLVLVLKLGYKNSTESLSMLRAFSCAPKNLKKDESEKLLSQHEISSKESVIS